VVIANDKVRQDFERATESYYEGDFAKYADGDYVSAQQQDDFTMFQSGYQAGRAAERAEIVAKLESEGLRTDISKAICSVNDPLNTDDPKLWEDEAKAAITKILEVI